MRTQLNFFQVFKYFLTETSTGLCYYRDIYGNLGKGSILSGIDYSLPQHPDGWEDLQVTYARNNTYKGLNRSFSVPLKFVGDGAFIIRKLFYTGRGIEQPITLVIVKWDENTGVYQPYYSGQLDLTQNVNDVATSITVNVMEGGILQLLKSYENTVVTIPCDGSIPENIKVNVDGIEFSDTFHYQILKITSPYPGAQPLPCTYLSNDGDNIGVIHGDQTLEQPYSSYTSRSANFLFSSLSPTSMRIKGSISVKSDPSIHNTMFYLYAVTSLSQPRGADNTGQDHAYGLVLPQNPLPTSTPPYFLPVNSQINIDGQRTFEYDVTIDLAANENLFIMFFNNFQNYPLQILGGSFSLTFTSKLPASRVWGITAYDAWRLMGERLNALASTTDYPFNYQFTSNLLQQFLRFVLTSGDALRASTTPDYFQYYNQATLNPANPNNQDYTQFASLGPVIKISISDFFTSINAILCAALGNQKDENGRDSIFIEAMKYVFDDSEVTLALGQVANFRVSVDTDHYFNWLEIGYGANQYDETSGKYEYNNTNYYQAPIKAMAKVLQLISKIRTDSYGIEFTRYNTQGGKSTTFNSSDNSLFFINTDFTNWIMDYYKATFSSSIINTTSAANTNILLTKQQNYQPIVCGTLDGEDYVDNIDFSILMINRSDAGTLPFTVSFTCLLNGLIGDSATVKMWCAGNLLQTWTQSITGVNTVLNGNFTSTRLWSLGDSVYFTIDTIKTCTVEVTEFSINIGGGYIIATLGGPQNITAGSTQQLVSLSTITSVLVNGLQVVSYGFQYFRFLSNINDKTFNWSSFISAYIQGPTTETVTFTLWRNGVKMGEVTYNATTVQSTINISEITQFSGQIVEQNYDMWWITASCGNAACWIYAADLLFESNSVKAYGLNRKSYSNVSGIPNPASAFNIEDFTPGRMLQRQSSFIHSCMSMIGAGSVIFQTADKNQFLSTTLNGVTITENASYDVHNMDDIMFYPLIFEFDTQVPLSAKQVFDYAANGYVSFIWQGKTFYGFPIQVSVKPALNDSQSWKLLAAPANNLADLVDLDWTGITSLQQLDVMIPFICPLHFVPLGLTPDVRYNTQNMDEDWFVNRVTDYADKNNYFAPWQLNDTISLQCQTNALSPVTAQILDCHGWPIGAPIDCPVNPSPSIVSPQAAYQVDLVLANLLPGEGNYYVLWTMGSGTSQAQFISEGINVKKFQPKTRLWQYSNTRNKLAVAFNATTPYTPSVRVPCQLNQYIPKSKFTTYVNEPQDITVLDGIPYNTWTLKIGFGSGIPDYFTRMLEFIMDLDTLLIDGTQYSRDEQAEAKIEYQTGQPKAYGEYIVRTGKNPAGTIISTLPNLPQYQEAGYVVNAQAFGQSNNNQTLINVTRTN